MFEKIELTDEQEMQLDRLLTEKGFSDKMDVCPLISLLEYNFIRNPQTKQYIYSNSRGFYVSDASIDDIMDALEDLTTSFYNYASDDSEAEYKARITNENLAYFLSDITDYNGWFCDNFTEFDKMSINELLEYLQEV